MSAITIEIVLKRRSSMKKDTIIPIVKSYFGANISRIKPNTVIRDFKDVILNDVVDCIILEGPNYEDDYFYMNFLNLNIKWYVYHLETLGTQVQTEQLEDGESVNFATHLMLPSSELLNMWENLYYEGNIKEDLLRYAETIMEFSDKGVDNNIISCNRVMLFHGPPGTGKSSLCKALAQKLAIRLQDRYESGVLIEINSHSLFSKWFSESGKLVTKMFDTIMEVVERPDCFVCLLIDEVESLTHARNQCLSGNEPSDSVRVVNAVLTQIDKIKKHPNVLILTTSNITEAIDLAFVDRADIKQYLGLPTLPAIYKIFHSCLEELIKRGILQSDSGLESPNKAINIQNIEYLSNVSRQLLKLCQKSLGLSGRCLRKIPFIAHALFSDESLSVERFLEALEKAIKHETEERHHFEKLNGMKV